MSPPLPEPSGRRCPICHRPQDEKFRPFCSKRCADIDLARWLSGSYAIAGRENEDADSAPKDEGAEEET